MEVLINGQSQVFASDMTLHDLVRHFDAEGPHIAIALNDTVIPRGRLIDTPVKNGDRVEIVRAVGGG